MELKRVNNSIEFGEWTFPLGSLTFENFMRGNQSCTRLHYGLKEIGEIDYQLEDLTIFFPDQTVGDFLPKVDINNIKSISMWMVMDDGKRIHYQNNEALKYTRFHLIQDVNHQKIWYIKDNELVLTQDNIVKAIFRQNLNLLDAK